MSTTKKPTTPGGGQQISAERWLEIIESDVKSAAGTMKINYFEHKSEDGTPQLVLVFSGVRICSVCKSSLLLAPGNERVCQHCAAAGASTEAGAKGTK